MNPDAPLQPMRRPERHVILVNPEIHWNTGNIGRTCLAVGARLHLIKPIGFSLDGKELRRASLDYWQQVKLSVWDSFDEMIAALACAAHPLSTPGGHLNKCPDLSASFSGSWRTG